jgi:DNA-binding transcriptional ArsR family regulator
MTKISLELDDIKALASDSRLGILKALDGKKLSLNNISEITKLNKATLHVHLSKLLEAEFIKKNEREGHKWVYYKLTWKGECLLHPENTRIVVLFSIAFVSFFVGVIQLLNFAKGTIVGFAQTLPKAEITQIFAVPKGVNTALFSQQAFQNVA